jgi:hypothetical protein
VDCGFFSDRAATGEAVSLFSGRRLLCVSPIPIGRDLFRAGAAATKRCLVCFAFSVAVLKFARLDRSTIRVLCPHELTEEDDVCRPRTASLLWRFPAPRASAAISMGCNLFSSGAEDRSPVNLRVEQRSCQIPARGSRARTALSGRCLPSLSNFQQVTRLGSERLCEAKRAHIFGD